MSHPGQIWSFSLFSFEALVGTPSYFWAISGSIRVGISNLSSPCRSIESATSIYLQNTNVGLSSKHRSTWACTWNRSWTGIGRYNVESLPSMSYYPATSTFLRLAFPLPASYHMSILASGKDIAQSSSRENNLQIKGSFWYLKNRIRDSQIFSLMAIFNLYRTCSRCGSRGPSWVGGSVVWLSGGIVGGCCSFCVSLECVFSGCRLILRGGCECLGDFGGDLWVFLHFKQVI